MKALVCREWGGLETLKLEEVAEPKPAPDQVLVAVEAAGVNFADTLMIQGRYQTKPDFPFSPGLEAAGRVVACGDACTRLKPGDRVMAILDHGGFAERAVARETETFPLPDNVDVAQAAGFLTAYISTDVALRWQAHLGPGDTLLVLGAAGGVGLAAVECGKAMGARVIAGASSAAKLEVAREHGADELIDYSIQDLKDEVMRLTDGRGVNVCYDPVGGDLFDKALSSLGWGGRILVIGFAGGVPQIPANRLLVKHRSAMGCSLRYFRHDRPARLQESAAALLGWLAEGKLKPLVSHRLPLDRGTEALKLLMDRKAIGKVVVDVAAG